MWDSVVRYFSVVNAIVFLAFGVAAGGGAGGVFVFVVWVFGLLVLVNVLGWSWVMNTISNTENREHTRRME